MTLNLPVHPATGLRALAVLRGRPVWPVMGAADDGEEASDPAKDPSRGFPADTPVAEMTPEQQVAYWKSNSRKHEATAKARGDYDDLKAKAARLAEVEAAGATEQEKAVKAARDEARAEERRDTAPLLVKAEFRAAAKGVLTPEQRDALLEDLDLTKYLTDKGEVDVAKVERKVAALAPKPDSKKEKFPDLGQGKRDGQAKPSVASGREMFEGRRKKPAA